MQPGTVQEHGGKEVRDLAPRVGYAYQTFTHGKPYPRRQCSGELPGDEPQITDRRCQRQRLPGPLHKEPHEDVRPYEADGYVRRSLSLIFVTVWKHRYSPNQL